MAAGDGAVVAMCAHVGGRGRHEWAHCNQAGWTDRSSRESEAWAACDVGVLREGAIRGM